MTPFSIAAALRREGDAFVATSPVDWSQGRATFGGLQAAWAWGAGATLAPEARALRGFSMQFLAPVAPGDVVLVGEVLAAGASMTHLRVDLRQAGNLVATYLGTYGVLRPSPIRVAAPPPPPPPSAEAIELPYIPGVTPVFTQHYGYRWGEHPVPYSGATEARLGGAMRCREEAPVDQRALVAMLDAWPGPVLPLMRTPAPAATLHWQVQIHHNPGLVAPELWWAYEAHSVVGAGGFAQADASLWAPTGELVATGRQLMAEFSR